MEIKLNKKHFLKSDNYCWWIEEEINPKEKDKDSYRSRVTGFYGQIEHLIENLIDVSLRKADVETLEDIKKEVTSLKDEIHQILPELQSKFTEKRVRSK
jgi:hypothetical protein